MTQRKCFLLGTFAICSLCLILYAEGSSRSTDALSVVGDAEADIVLGGGCAASVSKACPKYSSDDGCKYMGQQITSDTGDYQYTDDKQCGSCGVVTNTKNCTS